MKQSPFQEMKNTFHTMDELDLFNQSKNRLDQISEDSKLSRIIGKYMGGTLYTLLHQVSTPFRKEKEIVHNITLFLVEYCPNIVLSLPPK